MKKKPVPVERPDDITPFIGALREGQRDPDEPQVRFMLSHPASGRLFAGELPRCQLAQVVTQESIHGS